MPVGNWHQAELAGRSILFFPLFEQPQDNVRSRLPTSLKYTAKLLGQDFSSDFMHFHRLEPSLAALRWKGNKLLYIHNDIHQKIRGSKERKSFLWQRFPWLYFALEKTLLKQFDTVLSCNSDSTQFYKRQYPSIADRISYVLNAVDDEVFYPHPEVERQNRRQALIRELSLPSCTRFVLFAGRLHPQKDPLLLLRSISALRNSSVHLLIAGEGELKPAIGEEINRLNIASRVTLLGAVSQSQLLDLYNAASSFVLCSVYEGLPVVALESLACGTPVITTRAGDTPYLLTPGSGIVCEERSAEAMAAAIDRLVDNPEQYPQSSCLRAVSKYRGRSVINKIYTDMLQTWERREVSHYEYAA